MTWKLSSTEMLINEKLVLAVLNSSLVLVDDDDNDNPRPFQSSGHVNTCSKIPFHVPGHMTVLGQGSTSGGRLPFIIIIVTICFLCRHAMKWWEEWREGEEALDQLTRHKYLIKHPSSQLHELVMYLRTG